MKALPNTEAVAGKRIKRVEHGGDLSAIRRRFPEAPEPWIDLSTGINPVPYPVPELLAEAWARLPTRQQEEELLAAAARRYGVRDAGTIVAAPGTQALIQTIPRLEPRSRVAIVGPTYEEHEVSWRRQDHDVTVVADLDSAVGADVIVVVNPDNPTGRLVPTARLHSLDALLVADEAFIDMLPANASLAGHLPPRTLVLRSFGKTYGLAGLRLGFAIADRDLADKLRDELGPWVVSGPALEIGRRALDDDAWLQATAKRLAADRQRLDGVLVAAGFTIIGGTTLFCLAEHPDAPAMADRLARQGIHVRRFARTPTRLRLGLPADTAAFGRLAAALT